MAKKQSEKSPYQSRFAGGWLTPAQFIAEGMCDRIARKDKTELPLKFWETMPWKRHFLMQLRHANSLLKLYSAEAIMRALRTPSGKRVYSLGAKFVLDALIQQEQAKWEREQERLSQVKEEPAEPMKPVMPEAPRPVFIEKKSTLSKLRGLD